MKGPESLILQALEPIETLGARIWPHEALKNEAPPFAFYELRAEEYEQDLDGETELCYRRYFVHAVTGSYIQLAPLWQRMRRALLGLRGQTVAGRYVQEVRVKLASPELKELEISCFRRALELELWTSEEVEP